MNPNGVSKPSTPSGGVSVVRDPIVRVIVVVAIMAPGLGGRWERFPGKATLPGPDHFDEEAKYYGRLFEFCQVTFCCYSRVACQLWQNNPVAAVHHDSRLLGS